MKLRKILVASTLAGVAAVTLASCSSSESDGNAISGSYTSKNSYASSSEAYNDVFGAYDTALNSAEAEVDDINKRYAEMAVAEAKLLETGAFLPTSTEGGNYQVSNVAPRGVPYTYWGTDSEKFDHLVITNEKMKASDRTALTEAWNKIKAGETVTGYPTEGSEQTKWTTYCQNYLKNQGYTLKKTYNYTFTSDMATWDALNTSSSADSEFLVQGISNLLQYDSLGNQDYAMAESYTVSDDGLTYTFKIRKGAKWVDVDGNEYAEVTANDFVTGMQHALDAQAGLEFLVDGVIKGASEYMTSTTKDFSTVGVKALDEYTLQYTLESKTPYFLTMLGYNIFAPMNKTYYESKGGKFGAAFDATATDYTYGTSKDTILYNGAYIMTGYTSESEITLTKNQKYYKADEVTLDSVKYTYNDGSDSKSIYTEWKNGTKDGATLNSSVLQEAKDNGDYAQYATISNTQSSSYAMFFNVNRTQYVNFNDGTNVKTTKTDAQADRTVAAMKNINFRNALVRSVDRVAYNAAVYGSDTAKNSLRNTYTPGTFVSLTEDTTININGTATKFDKGTYYGEIIQAQLTADGSDLKVWDAENATSDGFDGWYNADSAKAYLTKAVEELKAQGITIDKKHKIIIEYVVGSYNDLYKARAAAIEQSVEGILGDYVDFVAVSASTRAQHLYAGYRINSGTEANFDVYDVSGWSPDYGDPSSYLDTVKNGGYMQMLFGINAE